VGLGQLVGTGLLGTVYPYREAGLCTVMAVVWPIHGVSFVGLLLRRGWSRIVSVGLALAWALLSARQLVERLPRWGPAQGPGVPILAAAIVFLIGLGVCLSVSRTVKSFLGDQRGMRALSW